MEISPAVKDTVTIIVGLLWIGAGVFVIGLAVALVVMRYRYICWLKNQLVNWPSSQ
jgi:hypothetical protein